MAGNQEKISVYNLAELKNTSDDAISNYLNSLKFRQSHTLTDVRLALGYGAVVLAGACFAWDYKFGFATTKYLTVGAVAVYTVLNACLTLWTWLVERGTVYVGIAPGVGGGNKKLRISTATKKNVPVYEITAEVSTGDKNETRETFTLKRPFNEWFDATGRFVAPPFQSMLATGIPLVGRLDPKRVVKDSAADAAVYTPEMLEALAKGVGEATGTETNKKGGKRRKA